MRDLDRFSKIQSHICSFIIFQIEAVQQWKIINLYRHEAIYYAHKDTIYHVMQLIKFIAMFQLQIKF